MWISEGARSGGRWLVVIHGGAWRDPRISSMNGIHLAQTLSRYFDGCCSVDYRLSPSVKHPVHQHDVESEIETLRAQWQPERTVVVGHSAGAFLAAQTAPVSKPELVICLEGIYSLSQLVEEYPSYSFFVEDAFGNNAVQWPKPYWSQIPKLLIIHSREDEFLSKRQSEWILQQTPTTSTFIQLPLGKHDDVFEKVDLEPYLRNYLEPKLH